MSTPPVPRMPLDPRTATAMPAGMTAEAMPHRGPLHALRNLVVIGLIAFLTLVDLFATQAILPPLTHAYGVTPAAMGLAVNACTLGMAIASLAVALFSTRIDRKRGILVSLALLSVPTLLLAAAPDLATFAALRIVQGLLMATAFSLTLAHLGERCSTREAAGTFAAYITGNVASNLCGRLMSAAVADHFGLAINFIVFAVLNLSGAVLVQFTIDRTATMSHAMTRIRPWASLGAHLRNPELRATFAIGFCILFAFIGTFTYVNFVLVQAPIGLEMMALGLVYFVFLPSLFTTPAAGVLALTLGVRPAYWLGIAAAGAGLPLLLAATLTPVILGLGLVGVGTFFAQAIVTGFVGRTAMGDRAAASGTYLACYFAGGLVGTAVLGFTFERLGWPATVLGIAVTLAIAAMLGTRLRLREQR
ncbi:MFS transporter [Elioraea sp.]|uniref:MFS transporter n=1 Tax=Elioraea sp. TaxID=2185103 RepID=UPI003F711D97